MKNETLRKQFRIQQILWAAMLISLSVYVGIVHIAGESVRGPFNEQIPLDLIRNILLGVSFAELVLIRFIRNKILTFERGTDQQMILQRYTVSSIISYAVSESIGIFGLALYLLGDSMQVFYSFIFISAAAMFYFRPDYSRLEEMVRQNRY